MGAFLAVVGSTLVVYTVGKEAGRVEGRNEERAKHDKESTESYLETPFGMIFHWYKGH